MAPAVAEGYVSQRLLGSVASMVADVGPGAVETARLIAETVHYRQLRRDGEPYFRHCERVAAAVRPLGSLAVVVGYLHDAVEDSDLDGPFLARLFPAEVARDVLTVSREPGETYEDYVWRICEGSDVALAVKLADLRDNLRTDPGRRLAERYRRAHERLAAEAAARGISGAGEAPAPESA